MDGDAHKPTTRKRAASSANTINAAKWVHTTVEDKVEGMDREETTDSASAVDNAKDEDPIAEYEKMKETFQKVYKVYFYLSVSI